MNISWLHQKKLAKLIVFCNGWGMDGTPFSTLGSNEYDVVMLNDYSLLSIPFDVLERTHDYEEVCLVAWSIGVWAGQKMFSNYPSLFERTIAVNGTLCPMHDKYGIPETIFEGTLLNYDEAGRKKFYHRMCRNKAVYKSFIANQPVRTIDNQLAELAALQKMIDCIPPEESIYQQVIITDNDLVVPTENQLAYWQETSTQNTLLEGMHFPFTIWQSWDEFLTYADSAYLT